MRVAGAKLFRSLLTAVDFVHESSEVRAATIGRFRIVGNPWTSREVIHDPSSAISNGEMKHSQKKKRRGMPPSVRS